MDKGGGRRVRQILEDALKRSKADYTEIRYEKTIATRVVYRYKRLEVASEVLEEGGTARALVRRGGWGITTFNHLEDVARFVQDAYECATALPAQDIKLAPSEPVVDEIRVSLGRDFRSVPLDRKVELASEYNSVMLGCGDSIVDTTSIYSDTMTEYYYINSEGTFIYEQRPEVMVYFVAVARRDGNVQQASESFAKPGGFEYAGGHARLAESAGRRAVSLLDAPPIKGGRYTVVLNQDLAGVFIHEAFGHLSEADFVYENKKAQELMVLGRKFGEKILNAGDDGSVAGLRGTHKYDDEGVKTRKNYLIKEGVLVGRLHSRETAAKMNEKPTGNARAINYRFPPIVRMTNTFIENGTIPFESLIADIKLGVYACNSMGGQTMLENFSFSAGWGHIIRNGRIEEMVRDVVLAGNLFVTLANIDGLGNDFRWIERGGGCGKNGQMPLPVTMGAPSVRIKDVIIGGKQR
ncbi:MAG: TldD/PmbA family protein [Planctomycetota bacterium]|nr:TldD/PmbA family protein [Planctomycetota bacterium]